MANTFHIQCKGNKHHTCQLIYAMANRGNSVNINIQIIFIQFLFWVQR